MTLAVTIAASGTKTDTVINIAAGAVTGAATGAMTGAATDAVTGDISPVFQATLSIINAARERASYRTLHRPLRRPLHHMSYRLLHRPLHHPLDRPLHCISRKPNVVKWVWHHSYLTFLIIGRGWRGCLLGVSKSVDYTDLGHFVYIYSNPSWPHLQWIFEEIYNIPLKKDQSISYNLQLFWLFSQRSITRIWDNIYNLRNTPHL